MKHHLLPPYLLPLAAALALGGCVSPYGWSEAPLDDGRYATGPAGSGAPVDWWGRDAASADVFYDALSGYGDWASHDRYGRVFLPNGVGAGWQPYSQGYWRDDPRRGRMWVSSEPWGWATYHYGRWGRDNRLGWFWVPDTRFGPGWVDWRASNGYASWAPIPPYGWSNSGYGYGNNWWVSAPGYWAYRPGNSHYMRPGRPGRPDWHDHNRPGQRPPQARPDPDGDALAGTVARTMIRQRQQAAPANRPQQATRPMPPRAGATRPGRGADGVQGARPPQVERPRAESPHSSAPRGNSGSGGRETRGRDISPRTADD